MAFSLGLSVGALSQRAFSWCKDTKFLSRLQVFRQLFFIFSSNVKIRLLA